MFHLDFSSMWVHLGVWFYRVLFIFNFLNNKILTNTGDCITYKSSSSSTYIISIFNIRRLSALFSSNTNKHHLVIDIILQNEKNSLSLNQIFLESSDKWSEISSHLRNKIHSENIYLTIHIVFAALERWLLNYFAIKLRFKFQTRFECV